MQHLESLLLISSMEPVSPAPVMMYSEVTGLQETPQMLTRPIFYIHVFTIMNHCLQVSYLRQFRPWIEVLQPGN